MLELAQLGCGGGAELVAQALAELLVDAQRLGAVAAGDEDLHQQRVSALAVGRELDELAGGALAGGELGAADAERDGGVALERGDVDLVQPLAELVGPGEVLVGQKPATGGEHRDQRRSPAARPVVLGDRGLGAVDRLLGRLEIDPRVGGKLEVDLAAAAQHVAAEDRAQAGEQRAERGVGAGGRAVGPQRFDQLVARGRERAGDGQVGEQHPGLSAGELRRELAAVELDGEAPAELDSSRWVVGQGWCKENRRSVQTGGTYGRAHDKEMVMAKVIRCQCGFLGRGETVEEAATVIEAHMREDHPELVGKVTREDLIAMAEEA